MKLKSYREFVNEIWNPAFAVPGIMLMNKAARNSKNKKNDEPEECKYENIGIGNDIQFTFKGKYYKLDFNQSKFHEFLNNPKTLCNYIDKNKSKWKINNE